MYYLLTRSVLSISVHKPNIMYYVTILYFASNGYPEKGVYSGFE